MTLAEAAAIAGIGATEFSMASGRSEPQLVAECVTHALADAGLSASDVDGLVSFMMDGTAKIALARELGIAELAFFSRIRCGGAATVEQAAMAVATGIADVVVAYQAFNERSGQRFVRVQPAAAAQVNSSGLDNAFHYPMGIATPAATVPMVARRCLHEYGATREGFGRIAVVDRAHAATNPAAWFHGRPITVAEHQASRWVAELLHLLDCCRESDGGAALVVTSVDAPAPCGTRLPSSPRPRRWV